MDLESAGAGVGTGIVSAILVALGINRRLEKLENAVVYKDTCDKCGIGNANQFKSLQEGQSRIESKIDDMLVNLSRRRDDIK